MSTAADARLLIGDGPWLTHADPGAGVRPVRMSDGPAGLRREAGPGTMPATCFPAPATLAATWNVSLVELVGRALAVEARSLGVDVLLAPGVNLKRTPLCGRNFEYFSEDPLLAGELAVGYVRGVQSGGVGASLKHYAANNQEHQRHSTSAEVDERTLRELYLAAFERVVQRVQPWTVMCSYNRLNGVHASQDRWLLTEVLRAEWGFEGLVVSDWGAVHDPVAAVAAGLDLQMPGDDGSAVAAIAAAVVAGRLDAALVGDAADRVRQLARRCGPPKPVTALPEQTWQEHAVLARRAAAEGTVLLRNDGVLPLDLPQGARVAVVGRQASTPVIQGGGSSTVVLRELSDPVPALAAALPQAVVEYCAGYDFEEIVEGRQLHRPAGDERAAELRAEALALATGSEVVIACVGHPDRVECEGYDRAELELPAD